MEGYTRIHQGHTRNEGKLSQKEPTIRNLEGAIFFRAKRKLSRMVFEQHAAHYGKNWLSSIRAQPVKRYLKSSLTRRPYALASAMKPLPARTMQRTAKAPAIR